TVKALVEEEIVYRPDGKTIFSINEYTPEGKIIKLTYYLEDGKTFNYIIEFDPPNMEEKQVYLLQF
ncbi:DUF2963 domain-containing protein, partial [Paulownia witches'-broom phytoplasma]|uniref:DUF2963 domain-containing protein n=1 Tax=Paulownia witches'-broom phytoplasma TaxID=39647 RepID=UPI0030D81D92